ncbi:DUF2993 domain-containing protein [Streptomyces solicathayae]|uniref:DUF2993 domain-containing protein n=1 Tax=Streptomyces solicathayae TaxID=3081768 RepID=A0ABZ0LXJ6_9ACTN|nr:DUF2993 domain-containing protein [Streptomyces sp. HUAS YS2]WOX23533.1 DUF2993 domain-containing protein [Streptomyces sp. HUAS YS2]
MRALRVVLIVAVLLIGALVGADRLAVAYVESEAADRVMLGPVRAGSTEVDIKGFPFLTQVADRRFDQVDVVVTGMETQAGKRKIRISELSVALHDVTVDGDWAGGKARSLTGTALVSYGDLTKAADSNVSVAYGGNGKVKVTGSFKLPLIGRTVTRSVVSTVTLVDGNTIRVRADEVPGEGIPGLEDLVRSRTDFERSIGDLPAGMKLERIEARADGVAIAVTGTNVALTG